MFRNTLGITVALLAVAVFAGADLGAQPPAAPAPAGRAAPQPQAIQQVKPGLFMITGAGANSLVRVTSQGLIVVDGKLPGEAN